ncbi:hypothetical protein D7V83_06930 [bacterium 0.1xD8-71]|nr:hypothetical protein D7V83_06930 [bacterium 0.1xD8-71]
MNRIINKRQAVCGTVWLIVLCIVISLWPLRLIRETVTSRSDEQVVMESEPVSGGSAIHQMFIAQFDKLQSIDVYLTEGAVGEDFNFVLYDGAMNIMMQQVISTKDMKEIPGYCRVQINMDLEVGKEYYFLLQNMEMEFRIGYADTAAANNPYIGPLFYSEMGDTQHCMIAAYHYVMPLRKAKTFVIDGFLLLLAILVTYLSGKYYGKYQEKNTLLTVERTMRAVLNPVIILLGIAAFIVIGPCMTFTNDMISIVFYEIGVLLAVLAALYAVNHDRTGCATDRTLADVLQERWQGYLQSIMFAGAIWACCNYMNGLYEIHHTVAYRQMLIFFALAVIVTYTRREIFNLVNLVYAAVAAVAGYFYYQNTVKLLEEPEELEILTVKLTAWVGILAGFVIINTIRILIGKKVGRISIGYGILVALFFALIVIYRNTRGWPVYLVCAFVLYYLRMAAWDKKAELLQNICNGILFHFGAMVVYCLLHRPYMYFQYYRYPFIFHTVTISAVYLALVVCAALVKFLYAYRRNPSFAGTYKELAMLGTAAAYLIFTLSRTGYLAILVTGILTVLLVCLSMENKGKRLLQCVGMMALAVLVSFPVVFTAQRMLPSVAAKPELHEIEEIPTELMHGRDMDSYYYITVERFVQVFQMKVLGVPEEECLNAFLFFSSADDMPVYKMYLDQKPPILLASTEDMAAAAAQEAEEEDSYTNGRFYIFRQYYRNLNAFGHEEMGITEADGNFLVHAHNIYLQVAYDHGIYVGIVFILLGVGTLVQSFIYYRKRKDDTVCAALPFAILVLFAVAGLAEWIFHPCCPIAYCLLLTLAPLLFDVRREEI